MRYGHAPKNGTRGIGYKLLNSELQVHMVFAFSARESFPPLDCTGANLAGYDSPSVVGWPFCYR